MTSFSGSEVGGRTWQVSPDLLCIFESDGRFSAVNPAWSATLGWSEAELVGTIYSDLLHPDDAAGTLKTLEALLENTPVLRYDNRYRHKDGSWRWLSWVAVPEDGKFYCSARDVSEQKAQATALTERTAERDHLWNLAQDMLARADYSGMMSAVSPSWTRVLGWSETELLTRGYASFMHPGDKEPTIEAIGRMARTHQPTRFENRIATSDGGWKSIEWTVSPEPDGVNFIAVGRDLSAAKAREAELEIAQEALRQSQKMDAIGQLTGGVAHDFNNLLTVIRGSADLLKRGGLTEDRRLKYVDAIADTADRATTLTAQLLAFARRQALVPKVVDVGASIAEVANIVRTLTGSRAELAVKLPRQALFAMADRSQLDTAVVNLAINARDAMNGEGRLTISVGAVSNIPEGRNHLAVAGDFVAITVADNGGGISADVMEHIFEPFFTTKTVGEGTGLGLSQVIGFAKQSGGDVHAQSNLGEGAIFTLYLPRAQAQAAEPAAKAAPSEVPARGACILVVEDNQSVGDFAASALRELGYDSVLAPDAEQALTWLAHEESRFQVVFSDIVMPGMSGIELAEQVRQGFPQVPIILTSGYSHVLAENGDHGFELLHKPYSIDQLSRVLSKALTWRALQETAVNVR